MHAGSKHGWADHGGRTAPELARLGWHISAMGILNEYIERKKQISRRKSEILDSAGRTIEVQPVNES